MTTIATKSAARRRYEHKRGESIAAGQMCWRCFILVFADERAAGRVKFSRTVNSIGMIDERGALCAACTAELAPG